MPFFSIIVAVYKAEKYLAKCIDSVLEQTFSDFEIILVDDGSPDNSPMICDEYARKDTRITVIHKENGGVSSARNVGLGIASGKYLWFVDSDDYILPGVLQRLHDSAAASMPDIVTFDMQVEEKNGTVHSRNIKDGEYAVTGNSILAAAFFWLPEFGNSGINVEAAGNIIKNDIVKANGILFDTKLFRSEDTLFVLECLAKSETGKSVSYPCYFYRCNPDSCMNTFEYSNRSIKNSVELLMGIKVVLANSNIPAEKYGEVWNKLFVRIPVEPFLHEKKMIPAAEKVREFIYCFSCVALKKDLVGGEKSKRQRFEEYVVFENRVLMFRMYIFFLKIYGKVLGR